MTEIAAELLEDVKPGDYIRVRYGTIGDQSIVEGTIVKWNENLLTIKKADGSATKVRLDDLRALDSIKLASDTSALPVSYSEETHYHMLRQMATLPPADPFTFVDSDQVDFVHNLIKGAPSTPFKQEIRGVLDSLDVTLKQHNLEYKYHDLRARTRPGDTLLFKGSRGMKMERALALFLNEPEEDDLPYENTTEETADE